MKEHATDPDYIYMQTLKTGQLSEDDILGSAISKDLMEILASIREAHITDITTADTTGTDIMKKALITKVLQKKPRLPCYSASLESSTIS